VIHKRRNERSEENASGKGTSETGCQKIRVWNTRGDEGGGGGTSVKAVLWGVPDRNAGKKPLRIPKKGLPIIFRGLEEVGKEKRDRVENGGGITLCSRSSTSK